VASNEQPEEQHMQLDDLHKQVAVPGVLEAAEKQWLGASYQHHVGMMAVEAK